MGVLLDGRRRQIGAKGSPLQLARAQKGVAAIGAQLAVIGVLRGFRPSETTGGVEIGDEQVEILNDELAAAGGVWAAGPRPRDIVLDGGRSLTVQGARAVREGAAVIGWSLWVRGA